LNYDLVPQHLSRIYFGFGGQLVTVKNQFGRPVIEDLMLYQSLDKFVRNGWQRHFAGIEARGKSRLIEFDQPQFVRR
jgi:hypothetical protein